MIRKHHVSNKFWTPYIVEQLPLSCEEGNVNYDKHVVAVRNKADAVGVGNAHREMSRVFWFFLQHGGTGKSFPAPRRSFTRNSFRMTATFSLAHTFYI